MADFVYKGRSADSIRQREQSGSDYDRFTTTDYPTYKPKEGENTVRLLPPGWMKSSKMVDKWGDQWGIEVWLHRNIGVDGGTYPCPLKMKSEPCPICEARNELLLEEGETDKYDKKDKDGKRKARPSDKLKPRLSVECLIIDRDEERAGPKAWTMPKTQIEVEIQTRSRHKKTGAPILVDHPEEGFDITFTRKGSRQTTKYSGVEVSREATPLSENPKRQEKWLAYITEHRLPNILIFYPYDYMEKVYMGKKVKERDEDEDLDNDEEEEEDEDEDEKPSKKKAKKSKSKSDDDDDDDDDSDDDDDDDDEDEDEDKPSKKKKSKSKSDDEDEDEDDDDDDKSSKKSKSKKKKSKSDDDDDDEDKDEDEDDDDDDEDEKPKKGSAAAKKAAAKLKKKKKSKDEDADDDDDDD